MNEFIVNASAEKKAALGKELGIEDWNTLQFDTFQEKASAYRESGKAEAYRNKIGKIKQMQEIAESKPKKIPRVIAIADGAVQRYADADSNFAVARTGDTFLVYDYATGNITRDMTRAELNAELTKYRNSKNAATSEVTADMNENKLNASEDLSSEDVVERRKITADMSENERYKALKDRTLENIPSVSEISESVTEKIPEISSWEDINRYLGSKKRSIIQKIAVEFGSIGKEYFNKDVQLSFAFSNNNFNETYKKQQTNYEEFAKMFSVFDSVVENAVGIEVHKRTDYKPDPTLENVFVLMSAYQDGDSIIPVKLEVKKFKDKKNTLYVAISLNKIKRTEVLGRGNTENGVTQQPRSVTTISIAKIFEKINPSDKSFLKYIPNDFLNAEQFKAKQEAIREDKKKSAKTSFAEQLPMEKKAKPTAKQIKEAAEIRKQDAEMEALAKEKIKDYAGLSKANQSMIRKVLREAKANGISEADALSYARVAARTGLDITFDKKACYNKKKGTYYAGFYDPDKNRITVNPETKKKHTVLLIHELSHAMRAYRTKGGEVKYFIDEDAKISATLYDEIEKQYADENGNIDEALILDEASSYYAEAIFGTQGAIDLLLGEKLTLKQKLLSFFKKSAAYYSTDEKLSKEARRHFRKFKAMFDAFTARNYGRNAETGLTGDKTDGRRYSMNVNIESEIDNALKNKFYRNHVKLTENTPDILLSQKSVRDLPLYMKPTHVRENIFNEAEAKAEGYKTGDDIHYHGLGKPKFIEVISDLDNVTEAYRGTKNAEKPQRREKYFLLISKIKDADGNTINVPIYINEHAEYHSVVVDTNKVATVFGREKLKEYLQREVQKGNLVRIKKKSLQVGDGTAHVAAAFGLKASDNSILNPDAKVNTSDENSSKKSSESGKRYSMDEDVDFYNEKQYNSFGWARASDAISKKELNDLYSKVNTKRTLRSFKRSSRGEAIVEVNNDPNRTLGTNNVFAFLKGTKNNFEILRVVRFDAQTEAEMDNIKESFYEGRTSSDTYLEVLKSEGLAREYRRENSPTFASYREGRSNGETRRGADSYNRRPVKYGSGYSLTLGEDGEITEKNSRRYSMDEDSTAAVLPKRTAREAGRKLISDGRYKQLIAGFLKAKSYSKKDAMSVINSLPLAFMIKGVSREKMAQSVWQVFNESVADKRMTEGQIKILARDLAEFFASSLMVATIETPNAISAREAISNLKRGIASLEISASERLELQNSVKKADLQRILARWKFKMNNAQGNKNPISIATFIENLAKEVPEMGFSTESNPVQTLIVIDAIYQQSDNKKTKNIA